MIVQTICVCGAGTMGSGIAQVSAQAGFSTILFDVNTSVLENAKQAIQKNLAFLVSKAKLTEADKELIQQRIVYTSTIENCLADLIIEAVIENLPVKTELFNQLATINSKHTILATNTSSLSVSDVAKAVYKPERVLGMHFFNPASLMRLVEIVQTPYTAKEVLATAMNIAKQMGKVPVLCKDVPGFIVNRVARHYYLEAMRLVEEELATIEEVDTIMEATGFKMGPFKLIDLIGMDVNYSVSNIVWNALGKPDRLKPSSLQKAKVEANELGKKTGKGFYQY